MTWSREMSHMLKILNFVFWTPFYDNLKMLRFDANPIRMGSGYRVKSNLWVLKTLLKKRIWPLSRPISLKRYFRHPTHSPWSCHIFNDISLIIKLWYFNFKNKILCYYRIVINKPLDFVQKQIFVDCRIMSDQNQDTGHAHYKNVTLN